jgi:LPS export ABC transporter permease LptF
MKTWDRYLTAEMAWPFAGGLLTFMVLITGHMLFLAIEVMVDHHVPFSAVLRYILYQLPGAAIMALPVATLLASALSLNRLARDHELVAVRCGGMSPLRMMMPAAGFGLLACGLSLWLAGSLAPHSKNAVDNLMRDILVQQKTLVFKPNQFVDTGRGMQLYAEDVNNATDTLHGLYAFSIRGKEPPLLLWAPEARFGSTTLVVPQPRMYALETSGALTWGDSDSIEIDLTRVGSSTPVRSGEVQAMTLGELRAQAEKSRPAGASAALTFEMEYQSRLAMAFTCLVFALLAGPVVLRFGRGQSLVGVLATMLVIFFYYVIMLWSRMLGNSGALPPLVATWGQPAALLVLAMLAIWRQR